MSILLSKFAKADFIGFGFPMQMTVEMGLIFAFKEIFAEPFGLGLKVLLLRRLHIQFFLQVSKVGENLKN